MLKRKKCRIPDGWLTFRDARANVFDGTSKQAKRGFYVGDPSFCPVCHQNLFSVKKGTLECALCQAKAEFGKVCGEMKLVFDPETLKAHRWSEEALLKHFSSAILPSGPRFVKEKDEIGKRIRKYHGFLDGK